MGINSTQAIILAVLHECPAAGTYIAAQTKTFSGHWNVTRSQIYRELPELAKQGFLIAGEPDKAQRWAQPFSITETGREAYREWFTRTNIQAVQHNPWMLRAKLSAYAYTQQVGTDLYTDAVQHYQGLLDTETDPLLRDLYAINLAWFASHTV